MPRLLQMPVLIQPAVMEQLLHLMAILQNENSIKDRETIGYLAGTATKQEIKCSHLIIPEQEGGPNHCITKDEHNFLV